MILNNRILSFRFQNKIYNRNRAGSPKFEIGLLLEVTFIGFLH